MKPLFQTKYSFQSILKNETIKSMNGGEYSSIIYSIVVNVLNLQYIVLTFLSIDQFIFMRVHRWVHPYILSGLMRKIEILKIGNQTTL